MQEKELMGMIRELYEAVAGKDRIFKHKVKEFEREFKDFDQRIVYSYDHTHTICHNNTIIKNMKNIVWGISTSTNKRTIFFSQDEYRAEPKDMKFYGYRNIVCARSVDELTIEEARAIEPHWKDFLREFYQQLKALEK